MPTSIDHRDEEYCQATIPNTRVPKILCVDDDPDFQTSIELRMQEYDVEIEHAFYGMQGIVEAANTQPDLILMDQAMPHGNGEYLLDVIKQNTNTSAIPVIVITGMRDAELKSRLLKAGAVAFLQKPVLFDDLLHQIGRLVDLRKRDSNGDLL